MAKPHAWGFENQGGASRLLLPLRDAQPRDKGCVLGGCSPAFHLCLPRKFLKIQCLESGQWEEGHCVPVVCEPPPPVFEGMYNCTQGFELDSQCVLNCEPPGVRVSDGDRGRLAARGASQRLKTAGLGAWVPPKSHCPSAFQVPIVCTKEGSWTEEFTLCDSLQGTCPPPPELNLVEYKCEQGHGIGESRLKLSVNATPMLIQPSRRASWKVTVTPLCVPIPTKSMEMFSLLSPF